MAKGRSGKASKAWANGSGGLDSNTFHRFIREAAALKQELNDANMAHAGQWKKAEPQGIHAQAAKLYCRIDDMEDTKRRDFLRSFDQYRAWSDWDAQADIFDDAPQTQAEDVGERDESAAEDAGEPAEREQTDATVAQEREPLVEVEADAGEETVTEADPLSVEAPLIFAAGKEAAAGGLAADDNPHEHGSLPHMWWANGHIAGTRQAAEPEGEVVPLKRGRRATAEAAASVH